MWRINLGERFVGFDVIGSGDVVEKAVDDVDDTVGTVDVVPFNCRTPY